MKLSREQLEGLIKNSTIDYKGKNLNGQCPFCGQMEFGIELAEPHRYNCYRKKACGQTGNVWTLLRHLGRSKDFIKDGSVNIFSKLESNLEKQEGVLDLSLPEIQPPFLWKRIYDDPYLRSRGFGEFEFNKYEVGRSKVKKEYVVFLVRREQKLVGYIGRSEKGKAWIDSYNKFQKEKGTDLFYPRYENSSTDFTKTLFGIDEVIESETTDVILVEGLFSKTKTDTNLFLDNSNIMKCCATNGAKISPEQIELLRLKGVKNIWLWFEADVLEIVKKTGVKLSSYFDVRVSYLNGRDPNDIGTDEALELLETAKDYLDFNMSYLNFTK